MAYGHEPPGLADGSPTGSPNDSPDTADRINFAVRMVQPEENLHLALDPRIPDSLERFPPVVEADQAIDRIPWLLNDQTLATTGGGQAVPLEPQPGAMDRLRQGQAQRRAAGISNRKDHLLGKVALPCE